MRSRTSIFAVALVALLLPAAAGAQPGVSVESGIGNDQSRAVVSPFHPAGRGNSTDTVQVAVALRAPQTTLSTLATPATATVPAVRIDPPTPAPTSAPVELDVEQIIRDVWPDNLEDHALRIAMRESRLQPGVHTWCCYGLMQIHKMHLAWLCPELGVCTVADLYDPRLNAEAAYALYLRDGWNPWRLG